MSYEGYGIRARKDLSANPRLKFALGMDAKLAVDTAKALNGEIERAEADKRSVISISTRGARRIVDALLTLEVADAVDREAETIAS